MLTPSLPFSPSLRAVAVAGAVVLVAVLQVPAPADAGRARSGPAAEATCGGQPATIVGTAGDDVLTGTSGADVIAGLNGDDVIRGLGGDDVICGGYGGDRLSGGSGDDRLIGGAQRRDVTKDIYLGDIVDFTGDRLVGGPGDDVIVPGQDPRAGTSDYYGDDVDYSLAPHGVRIVLTETGGARVTGLGTGTDFVAVPTAKPPYAVRYTGSAFDDTMLGSPLPDLLAGGSGDDRITGRGGFDNLFDGPGPVAGRSDDDVLLGGPTSDSINSTAGRDTIDGGAGGDTISLKSARPATVRGGYGYDTFDLDFPRTSGWSIDGGPGTNKLNIGDLYGSGGARPLVSVDRPHGTMTVDRRGGGPVLQGVLRGVGTYELYQDADLDFVGTSAEETIYANVLGAQAGRLHADMRGGDDFVQGTVNADVIDGGPGDDTVYGYGGGDRCPHTEHADQCDAS